MDKYYKIDVEERKATKIKANAGLIVANKGIEGYAMMWLNLTNNSRVNKKAILKIYNDDDNGIYVICENTAGNVEATEDYLQRMGLVIEYKEEVVVVQPDEVFNDDDLEVVLVQW